MTEKEQKAFEYILAKRSLKTRKVLDEAVKLAGTDELGRKIPTYFVVHQALVEYRDKLRKKKGR